MQVAENGEEGGTTMPAYVISNVEVFDQDAYGEYARLAPPAVEKHGGRFLARGGAAEVLEGGWEAHRVVVVEFPSVEQAKKFYNSPEYQAAKKAREDACDFKMLVVEGLQGPQR